MLAMRGIAKSFAGKPALDGVDLDVQAGEIHGLLGENGAGKSTLMRVVAGVVRPDAGSVTVAGRALRLGSPGASAAAGIGMVYQHFSFFSALTVAENLSLAAGAGPAFFRRAADLTGAGLAAGERLGWRFDPNTPVGQLSVGQQQRLEILKALQREARWLLLDEPTAVLTPLETDELFGVLDRLRREGRAIVFISHKLEEVRRVCDRITVLRQGRVVGEAGRGAPAARLAEWMIGAGEWQSESERANMPGVAGACPPAHSPVSRPVLAVAHLRVLNEHGGAALRDVSFELQRGEILGIAGVDGNGQRELAEAVVGLRRPFSGAVIVAAGDGRSSAADRRALAGYVPQDRQRDGLVLPMSVWENLVLEIHAAPEFRWGPFLRLSRLREQAGAMARRFDIRAADLRQPAATLSGGNQQKIVLARALTGARPLLVAVNPTRGLDVSATRSVHEQLRAARDAGVGILLISTELDEILSLSDRVGVLYAGRLQGIVPPSEPRARIGQMMGGAGGAA